jgi:hypothetical protein
VGVPRGNLSPEVDPKSSWRRAAPPEFRKERPRRVGSGEREEEADCRGGSARSERVESFFLEKERELRGGPWEWLPGLWCVLVLDWTKTWMFGIF